MVVIKLYLPNAVISRTDITIAAAGKDDDSDRAFARISKHITEQHGLTQFVLRYQDDEGDFCLISSEEEMRECIRVLTAGSRAGAALKLYVTVPGADGSLGPNPTVQSSPLVTAKATPTAAAAVPALGALAAAGTATSAAWVDPALVAAAKPAAAAADAKSAAPLNEPFVVVEEASKPVRPNALIAALDATVKPAVKPAATAAATAAAPATVQHSGVVCSVCGATPIVGVRYKCVTCSVDLCSTCEDAHEPTHVLVKAKTADAAIPDSKKIETLPPVAAATAAAAAAAAADVKSAPAKRANDLDGKCTCNRVVRRAKICTCFEAKFAEDVTLREPERVKRGSTIVKKWRVKNTGQRAWPVRPFLLHVAGSGVLISSDVPTAGCGAKQTVVITATVSLPAASAEPSARLFFRLGYMEDGSGDDASAEPILFGERIWIDNSWEAEAAAAVAPAPQTVTPIIAKPVAAAVPSVPAVETPVAAAASDAKAASAAVPVAAPAVSTVKAVEYTGKFAGELKQLRAMGFTAQTDDSILALLFTAHARKGGFNLNWVVDSLCKDA